MQHIRQELISWDEISTVWKNYLWIGRKDINPISCMKFTNGIDATIKKKFVPTHHGIYVNDRLVAVISGHKSSDVEYRCRGIFIHKEFRSQGYSRMLFDLVTKDAADNNATIIWSYPRLSALYAYTKAGFTEAGEIENTGFSGPNIRVYKKIRNQNG